MIYATDIDRNAADREQPCKDKGGFFRRCGNTILHSVIGLVLTAGVFIAVGGAALAALGK
jgi:hypothetical protein